MEAWLDGRFKSALVQYHLAQSYDDPQDPARVKILTETAKAFDLIYQAGRTTITGAFAHLWEGKCREELGDPRTALDIYDEVMTIDPEPGLGEQEIAALAPLRAQADYFCLLILAKQKPDEFLAQAEQWLKFHKQQKTTDGFQGVAFAVAEAKLAAAERGSYSDKSRAKKEAISILREMLTVPSRQQLSATRLLKSLGEGNGGEGR